MKRHLGLDVLRGVAILLVLFRHAHGDVELLTPLKRGGWIGVDLFFVLSGFLVSGLIFREFDQRGRVDVGRFLVRRGLKIYPLYYVFLAVTTLTCLAAGISITWDALAIHVFYVQNYGWALGVESWPMVWGPLWSLAVEEQFYLLLALGTVLACLRGGSRPFRFVPWLGLATIPVCLLLRVLAAREAPVTLGTHLIPTHLRIDALMLGVTLSYWTHYHPERVRGLARRCGPGLLVCGVALLGIPFLVDIDERGGATWLLVYGLTTNAVGAGLLLLYTISREWSPGRATNLLARIGRDSYSIYVWHYVVLQTLALVTVAILRVLTGIPFGLATLNVVYFVGSLLFGMLVARCVEWPILRFRDRLWPSRVGAGLLAQPSSSRQNGSIDGSGDAAGVNVEETEPPARKSSLPSSKPAPAKTPT